MGKSSKLYYIFTNNYHQSAQKKKYSSYNSSYSQDERVKKNKRDIMIQKLPKKLLGIRLIQNISLSYPSSLFLDELGDDIIQAKTKDGNYKLNRIQRYIKVHQIKLNSEIKIEK